jgi:hypothetical protein
MSSPCFPPPPPPLNLQEVVPEADTATLWINRDGSVLSADPTFTDWFAYSTKV